MKKHAYLIIAHHQFELLNILCSLLDKPYNDFFILIDKKSKNFDEDLIKKNVRTSNITFVERVNIMWGGFSQIQAELNLLKGAIKGEYSYYHLLSGVDLPIKTADEIYKFFEANAGTEFLHYCAESFSSGDSVQNRVRYYYPWREKIGRSQGLKRNLEKIYLRLQKILGIDRRKSFDGTFYCGSNWFSITHDFATYVLNQMDWTMKYMTKGFCVDEMWLQTILLNSEFKDKLYDKYPFDDYRKCMRMVDWVRGNPYTWRTEDFDELMASECLFARKFDWDIDSEICLKIKNCIK